MNQIQKISQDLLNQKLKLQMGIDPRVEISHEKLQQMWAQVQQENNLTRAHEGGDGHIHDRAA